jgi:ribose 5-phosphate isomerase B
MNGEGTRPARGSARGASAPSAGTRVALGADHGGYALKETLKRFLLEELGASVVDCGTHSTEAVDYPDIAADVARRVANGSCDRGIVIDGAGIGSSMAANKIPGVRAAVCHDDRTILNSRSHNDANVLCLGSSVVPRGLARRLVRLWLAEPFAGGRHQLRVDKVNALDRTPGAGAEKGSGNR